MRDQQGCNSEQRNLRPFSEPNASEQGDETYNIKSIWNWRQRQARSSSQVAATTKGLEDEGTSMALRPRPSSAKLLVEIEPQRWEFLS